MARLGAIPTSTSVYTATEVDTLIKGRLRVYDVQDYGAVADGTTNDGTAIKNAMDAANTAGGGIVQLMPGVHAVSAAITNSYKNITLRGYAGVSILKATGAFTNGILNLDAASSYISDVSVENVIFDCNNQANVMVVSIKGGTYSAGAYVNRINFRNCVFKNSVNTTTGMFTIYHGRSSTLGDRGQVSNIYFWNCDFGKATKYQFYLQGSKIDTLQFNYCDFHDGEQPYSFGWNTPSLRGDTLSQARSNKGLRFNYCKWYNMNTTAVVGFFINDVARTGWRDIEFNHCEITGHGISFTADPIPANQEMFWNGHSVQHLVFDSCVFRDVKSCFSLGQSNNGPYYQTDPEHGVWITNCRFYRCYNFADFDSAIVAKITGNYFYEMYLQAITLGYSNHDSSIFANNTLYNNILVDKASPGTSSSDTAAISAQPHGWHVYGNTIKDDRLLVDPTTAPVLSAIAASGAPGGTYYFAYTWWNDTGETLLSSVSSITVTAGQTVKVVHPESSSYGNPTGAKRVNFYGGTAPGSLTLQDYMPTAIHLDYETDHYTTYKEPYWQMPTAGLITGTTSPVSNTTHTRMNFGVHEVGSAVGPLVPNTYESNDFYGIPTEFNHVYPHISFNNRTNRTFAQTTSQLVERIPRSLGNITGATTFNVLTAEVMSGTITGNITATVTDGWYVGQKMERRFTMGGSGSYTYTKAANETLAGGSYTPSSTVGAIDTLVQEWTGTTWKEIYRSNGDLAIIDGGSA
jgi:hypothetical protein